MIFFVKMSLLQWISNDFSFFTERCLDSHILRLEMEVLDLDVSEIEDQSLQGTGL